MPEIPPSGSRRGPRCCSPGGYCPRSVRGRRVATWAAEVLRLARRVDPPWSLNYPNDAKLVAVKIMPRLAGIAKEMIVLAQTGHQHIVGLYGTQIDLDKGRAYMVMELCVGGELFDRIAECGKMDEESASRYFYQMASALAH